MANRSRYWMRIQTQTRPQAALPSEAGVRLVGAGDVPALGELMKRAYEGTIDDEGETLEQCVQEIQDTLTGKYGPFLSHASFCGLEGHHIVSASIITLWKERPLVAFTMTDPLHRGKGLSHALLSRSVSAVFEQGYPELFLVVTEGNTSAEKLYQKLGFENLGPALPGNPPPEIAENVKISVEDPTSDLEKVIQFYRSCNYSGSPSKGDQLVVARLGSEIVGVVRLSLESGVHVLRGMEVKASLHHRKIGKRMLERFEALVRERNIQRVYCLAWSYLEGFYETIGFRTTAPDESVPEFLSTRFAQYQAVFGNMKLLVRDRA